ncbi:MAG: helix-turn-helix domain-containing protein, partial [Christensenellales bacterium]
DTKNVLYLLKKIFQNIKFQETPYFDCLVYCLFNDISDMYSEQLVPKPLGNVLINKAVKYIENNYKGTINTVALAKSVGVSQQYINKLFKPAFGMTLIEYINYVRIKISINYLRNTTLTINQISKNIGFNTPRYYARVFKKHFKMTPMEYRASVSEHFRKRDLAEWEQAEFKRFK